MRTKRPSRSWPCISAHWQRHDGATLAGRIRAIEKADGPAGSFTLALEFSELQIGNRKARFFARLTEVKSPAGEVRKMKEEGLLGVGMLQIRGDRFQLSHELRLVWKFGDQ